MKHNRSGLRRIVAGILISTGLIAGGVAAVVGQQPAAVAQSWHGGHG